MSLTAIEGLKPEVLWKRFYEISQVPRPSKKEGKILEYVRNFAKLHNLEFKEDKTGNILIKVPATKGYEDAPVVVLQGHVDMVCEKNKGTEHDFDNDPIKLINEGEWMKADGTTLGADNGIGVAASLATVTDKDFVHGPLEILCTVDEETGLTGANNLEPGFVSGKILINMDSEEDGAFYVGCAGGQDTVGLLDIETETAPDGLNPYEIMITGLKGGHSGLDIQNGRANAIKILARLLHKLRGIDFKVSQMSGGSLRNAIPREAELLLWIRDSDAEEVQSLIDIFVAEALKEYLTNDPDLIIKFDKLAGADDRSVYTDSFAKKVIDVIFAMPNGIIAMSPTIENLVETSTNLATVNLAEGKLRIGTSQRSSIEPAKGNIAQSVKSVFSLAGAEILEGDGYPGWQPNLKSELLKRSQDVYERLFEEKAEIKAIHAGLECGILGDRYPGLDMISFGPTITGAHSPDERVNIKDVEKFYKLLRGILVEIAENK
jgi:dipeptidase D